MLGAEQPSNCDMDLVNILHGFATEKARMTTQSRSLETLGTWSQYDLTSAAAAPCSNSKQNAGNSNHKRLKNAQVHCAGACFPAEAVLDACASENVYMLFILYIHTIYIHTTYT